MQEDREKGDSVFDFLYSDLTRISIFTAQLHQFGDLTQITKSIQTQSKITGQLDVAIAKTGSDKSSSTTIQEQYNSGGLAPLLFLDEIGRRNMLVRTPEKARIGQLLLVTGVLKIQDLSFIQDLWQNEFVVKSIENMEGFGPEESGSASLNAKDRRKIARQKANTPSQAKAMSQMLGMMPHMIQGSISTINSSYWFTLKKDGLSIGSEDLLLKHGTSIAGNWAVVAILDALREEGAQQPESFELAPPSGISNITHVLEKAIAPLARIMVGRPHDCFGLTPLLIFREVEAA